MGFQLGRGGPLNWGLLPTEKKFPFTTPEGALATLPALQPFWPRGGLAGAAAEAAEAL